MRKKSALLSVAADQQGFKSDYGFNLHHELSKVKFSDSVFSALYRDPSLTAGHTGNFPSLGGGDGGLFDYSPGKFRLREFENISIDKVTLLFPAPRRSGSDTIGRYWKYFDLMLDSGHPEPGMSNTLYGHSCKWNHEYFIQWDCVQNDWPTIRLEFNPNKAELSKLKVFFSALSSQAFDATRISRIDIAVDYAIHIEPLGWSCQGVKSKNTFEFNDRIVSRYFGAKGSDLQIRVYDKRKELADKSNIALPCSFWRVEAQLSKINKNDIDLNDWKVFSRFSPFGKLTYNDLFNFDCSGQGAYSTFVRLARLVGVDSAVKDFDYKTRKIYRERLQNDCPDVKFNLPDVIYKNCFPVVYLNFLKLLREMFQEAQEKRGIVLYEKE